MLLPNIPLPKCVSSEIAYKGFLSIRIDMLSLPHGIRKPYSVLETGHHAAAILSITAEGKFLVTKEYRHPTGKWLYGCPGGRIDGGESPIEAAQRELLEETGYTAKEFITLGEAHPFPAACDQKIHYILAKEAQKIEEPRLEPMELIETEELNPEELHRAIQSGYPVDGVLCTALLFYSLQK